MVSSAPSRRALGYVMTWSKLKKKRSRKIIFLSAYYILRSASISVTEEKEAAPGPQNGPPFE